jgi:hypothetical protein
MLRDLLYILVYPCFALPFYLLAIHSPPGDVVLRTVAILAGFLLIDRLISRGQPFPGPFRVYALLGVLAMLLGLGAYALSFLGPAGVLAVVTLLAAATTLATILRRPRLREAREAAGLCITCGYDLRATEDRCPECNTRIPEYLRRRRRIAADLSAMKNRRHSEAPPA